MKNKDFKIFGVRQSPLGDCISALPILTYLEQKYPNSYKYWHLAEEYSEAAPLFSHHPLIDEVVIADSKKKGEKGLGPKDKALAESCDVVIDTDPPYLEPLNPQLHDVEGYSYRNRGEDVWLRAGLPAELYEKQEDGRPKLVKWFDVEKKPNTIAIQCCINPNNPIDISRSPCLKWWENLVMRIVDEFDCTIYRLGDPKETDLNVVDPTTGWDTKKIYTVEDHRELPFFDQVKKALSADIYIGIDSSFSLVMGAYSQFQITLLTNWHAGHLVSMASSPAYGDMIEGVPVANPNWKGHFIKKAELLGNPMACEPLNKYNHTFFQHINHGGCSSINIASVANVIGKMKQVISGK